MPKSKKAFVGYSSLIPGIGHAIEPACKQFAGLEVNGWPQVFEPGVAIIKNIIEAIK